MTLTTNNSSVAVVSNDKEFRKCVFTVCSENEIQCTLGKKASYTRYSAVFCESSLLEYVKNPDNVVVVLSGDEDIESLMKTYKRFLFSKEDKLQILYCIKNIVKVKKDVITRRFSSVRPDKVTVPVGAGDVTLGLLRANFDRNEFYYRDKEVYFTTAEKEYLARLLFTKENLSKYRFHLCNIRKKVGKSFLR